MKLWIGLWIDVWNDYDYEMTMKWLWNDYEFIYEFWYEMNYETTYEIMIWIDYELSASSMKKYEFMCEKVFFNKLFIWKCMNHLNSLVWGVHLSRT